MDFEKHCVRFASGYIGNPRIAPIDRDNCIIADGSGHISVFSLSSKQVLARVYIGVKDLDACINLRSLCVEPSESKTAAVATRGGHAVIYDLERQVATRLHPEQGNTVNSVALSPDGQLLAVGTGCYPLSGNQQPALVELWSLETDGPKYLAFVALPGACVDAITWDTYGQQIAVATGLASQDRGFVASINASNLRPLAFVEIPIAGFNRLIYVDVEGNSSHLAVACKSAMYLLKCHDWTEEWKIEAMAEELADFA